MTTILWHKPTVVSDVWTTAPKVSSRQNGKWVERDPTPDELNTLIAAETKPSTRDQLREAGVMLAIFALTFPIFFEIAHWLRG